MRKVVLAMMTTLNGRLDDPDAFVTDVSDDHYREIDRVYATFDTVLVGRTTYEEMLEYWPGAETAEGGSDVNKSMARKMNTYKKYVFSTGAERPLEWNNAEQVMVNGDDELRQFVVDLKAQPGGDIHLAGGARLAQSIVGLGLVDEYHFFVFPVVSAGAAWFDQIKGKVSMELLSASTYANGVVGLYYKAATRPD